MPRAALHGRSARRLVDRGRRERVGADFWGAHTGQNGQSENERKRPRRSIEGLMWKKEAHERQAKLARKTKRYASDMINMEWVAIKELLPQEASRDRRRQCDLREVLNALRYLVRSGRQACPRSGIIDSQSVNAGWLNVPSAGWCAGGGSCVTTSTALMSPRP
ncbi:hypothetical protein DFQ28_011602 [Apophysomyces sp. BC1034]|nr:hypothetical protein DFQ28_011602 [Apophysomyces sp. BC1034]